MDREVSNVVVMHETQKEISKALGPKETMIVEDTEVSLILLTGLRYR